MSGLTSVTSVAAGQNFSLALRNDGTVWAWGDNAHGQLGDGTKTKALRRSRSPAVADRRDLGGRGAQPRGRRDGTVWAWG